MEINITINGVKKTWRCEPGDTLLRVLRREGYYSVRFGSDTGETGASAVLLDGQLVSTEVMLAAQADGHTIETVEGMSQGLNLHPIQQAFIRTGAIQSGYATPAMVLAAKALIEKNPNPTEAEVRDAISGVLDRETGYVKPVQAILEAAAVMRGEEPTTVEPNVVTPIVLPGSDFSDLFRPRDEEGDSGTDGPEMAGGSGSAGDVGTKRIVLPKFVIAPEAPELKVVGKSETKVDAIKLAKGNPAFVDDFEMRGMLYAKLLTSPHAHARIVD
ncbi:MAG: 2Fe-2S iron-sulfur cluster-binding protein, partial [Anaerolineae bacterium]